MNVLRLLAFVVFALLLTTSPSLVGAKKSAIKKKRREHSRKHGKLMREYKETSSASRKQALEKELATVRRQKKVLKYQAKGHSEEESDKIVSLETRLHALQDQRRDSKRSQEAAAEARAEMKSLRTELSRLKFPNEKQRRAKGARGGSVKSTVKNVKELRTKAKNLRQQLRSTTDLAAQQKLTAQLEALYD